MNANATMPLNMNVIEACIRKATLAASSHNTQPWRFRIHGECIELIADRTRSLPVNDPYDRELTISCGAALFNLRVAAASAGLGSLVDTLPGSDPDLLARVTVFSGQTRGIADATALGEALPLRRTYRRPFLPTPVPENVTQTLQAAATLEGSTLTPIYSDNLRRDVIGVVEEADRRLWNNPHWRRELSSWMHPRRSGEGFGVPGLALTAAQLVVRSFDLGGGIAARGAQILTGSPLLMLLASSGDTPADWLATGQALQRVLLRACADGLQASFLTQPMHAPDLRIQLAGLLPQAGVPQILLRAGFTSEKLASVVRRPLEQILDIDWIGH
ncbi:MAG: nitroreductase [Pseudomonadota bacterium]